MEFYYWKIKGIGEPLRYLMENYNIQYKEKNPSSERYWRNEKQKLRKQGYIFVNLPFILEDDNLISGQFAIAKYINRKINGNLFGNNNLDKIKHTMISSVLNEMNHDMYEVSKNEKPINKCNQKQQKLDKKYKYLSQFLGQKQYLFGYITFSDFMFLHNTRMYQSMILNLQIKENYLEKYKNLIDLKERMENFEGIQKYLQNNIRNQYLYFPTKDKKFIFNQFQFSNRFQKKSLNIINELRYKFRIKI